MKGILRVPVLYGAVESLEESAITVLAKHLFDTSPVTVDDVQKRFLSFSLTVDIPLTSMTLQLSVGNWLNVNLFIVVFMVCLLLDPRWTLSSLPLKLFVLIEFFELDSRQERGIGHPKNNSLNIRS